MERRLDRSIDCLVEQNRVLEEQLGGGRLDPYRGPTALIERSTR